MTDAPVGEKRSAQHDPRPPSPGPSDWKRVKLQTDSVVEGSTMEGVEELEKPGSSTKRPHGQPRPKRERNKDKESRSRGRRQMRNEEDANKVDEATGQEEGPKAPRYPKRQCALLIGFCGSGYSGMQMYGSRKAYASLCC